MISNTLHNDSTIEIGATGTNNLQFFFKYNNVPGIYFLNIALISYLFFLALGICYIAGNLSSHEFE